VLTLSYTNGQLIQVQVTFSSSKGGTFFAVKHATSGPPFITLSSGTFTLK
jgi:hypothetical protein